jgi:hypothetical protein
VLGEIDAAEVAELVGKKWDQDEQEELLRRQLKPLSPERVLRLLRDVWDDDRLQSLSAQIMKHLRPRPAAGTEPGIEVQYTIVQEPAQEPVRVLVEYAEDIKKGF